MATAIAAACLDHEPRPELCSLALYAGPVVRRLEIATAIAAACLGHEPRPELCSLALVAGSVVRAR